jgi:hypothetical protein
MLHVERSRSVPYETLTQMVFCAKTFFTCPTLKTGPVARTCRQEPTPQQPARQQEPSSSMHRSGNIQQSVRLWLLLPDCAYCVQSYVHHPARYTGVYWLGIAEIKCFSHFPCAPVSIRVPYVSFWSEKRACFAPERAYVAESTLGDSSWARTA